MLWIDYDENASKLTLIDKDTGLPKFHYNIKSATVYLTLNEK